MAFDAKNPGSWNGNSKILTITPVGPQKVTAMLMDGAGNTLASATQPINEIN